MPSATCSAPYPANPPCPRWRGSCCSAAGSSLFLAGFVLDLGITTTIEAEVREPGEIVLTARLFGEIVRRMPGESVMLVTDEKLSHHPAAT